MGINATSHHIPSIAAADRVNTPSPVAVTRTVEVHNAAELNAALANVQSGTEIHMADGVYQGNFELANKTGVTLSGSPNAVLKASDGYALHLQNSSNNSLQGFTVDGGRVGIMLDQSNGNTLSQLTVQNTGNEGIHFRDSSSNNTLQHSNIHDTGLVNAGFGEGVYIGSADHNNAHDYSNNNSIINNTISHTGAESIDVKDHTEGGKIIGNIFDTTGMRGEHFANSAVDMKPDTKNYLIQDNTTRGIGLGAAIRDITTHGGSNSSNQIHDNQI